MRFARLGFDIFMKQTFLKLVIAIRKNVRLKCFSKLELLNCRYDPIIMVTDPHSLSADLDKALSNTWDPDYRFVAQNV